MNTDKPITHRCGGSEGCMCMYDPECNPNIEPIALVRVDELLSNDALGRVADALHSEFRGWMGDDVRVALFDWTVAARNAMNAALKTGKEPPS